MTSPEELAWNQAIEDEDYESAEVIAKDLFRIAIDGEILKPSEEVTAPAESSGNTVDILDTYAYWGLDIPGLPVQGTP